MDDQFVSGVDRIESAGGQCVRLVTYVLRDLDGEMTRCEGPHVVMPLDALPDAVGKACHGPADHSAAEWAGFIGELRN